MPMTKVYRVQDKEGRGPYRPGFSAKWRDPNSSNEDKPPFFVEFGWDVVGRVPSGHHAGCAFRTMGQLRSWFSPTELERLRWLGYSVVEIEVDRVLAESQKQLVFCRVVPLSEGARALS